jgi:hypothetical protein
MRGDNTSTTNIVIVGHNQNTFGERLSTEESLREGLPP